MESSTLAMMLRTTRTKHPPTTTKATTTHTLSPPPFLFLCVLLCGVLAVHADIQQGSLSVPPLVVGGVLERPNGFMEFGFQQNGSVSLFMTADPPEITLYLVICSESDQYQFGSQADKMCESLNTGDEVCQVTEAWHDQIRLFYLVPRYGYYYFNLVNCHHDTRVLVNVYATLLNPGNNYLTATLVPAPTMFAVMTALWMGVTFAWGLHVIAWWRAAVGLHRLMFIYPAAKVVFTWYAHHYYLGRADDTWREVDQLVYWSSYIIFQVVFNLLLLVLSRGWGISKANLKSDKYYIFSILASMLIIMMFRYLYATINQILELVITLGLIGFRVTIVVYVFMGVNYTIRHLETAMFNYNIDVQNIDSHYTLIKRHKMYILVKVILITWLALNTAAFFTNLMLFEGSDDNWVALMNTEFLDFILFAMVACNFRLRPSTNLFLANTAASASSRDTNNGGSGATSSTPNHFEDGATPGGDTQIGNIEMVSLRSRPSHTVINNVDLAQPSDGASILTASDDVSEVVENGEVEEDEVVLINKRR